METIDNTIYFESDQEFEDFCVAPYAVIKQSDSGLYYEGDYSDMYKESIEKGLSFVIKDENSLVYKRGCVSKRVPVRGTNDGRTPIRLVQLPVQNLKPYY